MSAAPTKPIIDGLRTAAAGGRDAFASLAKKAGGALKDADAFVVGKKGFRNTAAHFWETKPVSTLAVTGAAVAGTAVIGTNMASALSSDRSESRGR